MTDDRSKLFLVTRIFDLISGRLRIITPEGSEKWAKPEDLSTFEITEDQARHWAKHELGQTLEELKHGIDERLTELRRQLDERNQAPIAEDTTVTPNAAPALFELLKKLPGVIGKSLSGDESRVELAKTAMANLQRQLKEAGIDLDEQFTNFPDRVADLRKNLEEQTAAKKPGMNQTEL